MLRLLARRALVQLPLLAAVVAVVAVGATLLGVCALLLTTSQERSLSEGMSRAEPKAVEVTAYVTAVNGENARSVAEDTRTMLARTLAPFSTTSATRASSIMRPLGVGSEQRPRRLAYLSGVDGLAERAALTRGRWPRPAAEPGATEPARPIEAVVLESTARLLQLTVGSQVELGAEISSADKTATVKMTVVGVVRPLADTGWDRDPLGGTGHDPAYMDGRHPQTGHAYGPFLVDLSDLYASGSELDRMQITTRPDLSAPTSTDLDAAATALIGADLRLTKVLGERVENERIASALPATLGIARSQQAVTRSTVLIVVLLGTALTAAALGLAGRLVAALRVSETALLSALGAGRGQLAAAAVVEAATLAVVAAALAVPLSSLAHSTLTHLPMLVDAGLATRPVVTGAQVLAVVVGAVLLATVLVVPALRPDPASAVVTRSPLGLLTRSGGDLVLLALAVTGWWQLRAQPVTQTGTRTDTVLVLAPVLCLVAGAALAPRVVSLPLRAAERLARRSRGLVLALAAFEAARRPRAVAAGLLLALAAAAGTFGLAFGATWEQSQRDQADARVGTDLALTLAGAAAPGQVAAIATATGGTVSAVVDRPVIVGRYIGDLGSQPRLVAVDTTQGDALLRGEPPAGATWAQVGADLAPKTPVTGIALPAGNDPGLTLEGNTDTGPQLRAVPRLVLQDPQGLRLPCDAPAVPLDGRPHRLRLCGPLAEGLQLVAVSLQFELDQPDGSSGTISEADLAGKASVAVDLSMPMAEGTPAAGSSTWTGSSAGSNPRLLGRPKAEVSSSGGKTVVRTTAEVNLAGLLYDTTSVVSTAFEPPPVMPIAVSRNLTDALSSSVDTEMTITIGTTPVPAEVVRVLPQVPSAPGEVAVLADIDNLSRALIVAGDFESTLDTYWAGRLTEPDAAARTSALKLGEVVTRAGVTDQLTRGPLRVGLPAALTLLISAVVLLVLAGTIMHVMSDVEARAIEVARLRGLGLSRRDVLRGLLAQYGGVMVLLLGAGAVVGAVAAWVVGPLLIRSDLGAAPVPAALAQWPWWAESALLGGLLIGSIAAVTVVITVQVRRADAAHLRVGA